MNVAKLQLELQFSPNHNHHAVMPDAFEISISSENLHLFCQSRWLQNNLAVLCENKIILCVCVNNLLF